MDDLLDLYESTDSKPFKDSQPTQSYNKFDKKPKEKTPWDDINIEPKKIDMTKMVTGKSFTVIVHKGEDGIKPEIEDRILEISKLLVEKQKYGFRHNGEKYDLYDKIIDVDPSKAESYLPWKKFNEDVTSVIPRPSLTAYQHAAFYHKAFKKLPNPVRAIISKDIHVILGKECDSPIEFLICFSNDGADSIKSTNFKTTGPLSFPIAVCEQMGIPVFNLKNDGAFKKLVEFIKNSNSLN